MTRSNRPEFPFRTERHVSALSSDPSVEQEVGATNVVSVVKGLLVSERRRRCRFCGRFSNVPDTVWNGNASRFILPQPKY